MRVTKLVAAFLRYFADQMDAEVERSSVAGPRIVVEHLHVSDPAAFRAELARMGFGAPTPAGAEPAAGGSNQRPAGGKADPFERFPRPARRQKGR